MVQKRYKIIHSQNPSKSLYLFELLFFEISIIFPYMKIFISLHAKMNDFVTFLQESFDFTTCLGEWTLKNVTRYRYTRYPQI